MSKLLQILGSVDWKTAGWKTYLGLAIVVACVVAEHLGQLDKEAAGAGVMFGCMIAAVGRFAAGRREDPPEKPPEPPVVTSVAE